MKIPSKVKIKKGVYYKVVWQNLIKEDESCMGLCDPNDRIIYLKLEMSDTDILKSFLHELLHCIEFEWNQPIPHKITETMEEGIFKVLKLNKWL